MNRDLSFLKEKYIAHRGLHNDLVLENTMEAFKKAIEAGYPIELDVHLLHDNSVVVFHDDNLIRMANINRKIKDVTYDEIKNIKLKGSNNYIPLFKDVLNLVNGRVPLLIELKYDCKTGLLEDKVMNILKDYKGPYAIQSFSVLSLIYLKKHYPYVLRGQLASNYRFGVKHPIICFHSKHLLFNFLTKPDFISYDIKLLPNKKISKLRKKKTIFCWTIRNEKDLAKGLENCDNVIAERILH